MKMENNINQGLSGAHQKQASFMLVGGGKSSNCSPLPVKGEVFSLTFPFIDQAFAQACAVRSPKTHPPPPVAVLYVNSTAVVPNH